jgi:hypothetical protein
MPFFMLDMGILVITLVALMTRRISSATASGLLALGNYGLCLAGFITENTVAASIAGAGATYFAWDWWNDGGGDGTKRRLRALRDRFRGVRRTAPAGT